MTTREKKSFITRTKCRLCDSKKLRKIIDLPPTIPGEQIKLKKNEKDLMLVPIDIYCCIDCGHAQLIHIPNKDNLWGPEYTFMPSDNPEIVKHFKKTINFLSKNYIKNIKFAFEIGSNDGLFLKLIKDKYNCKILGIDPSSQPVKVALRNDIPTIQDFFNTKNFLKIKKKYEKPDLIIANNIFAHMDNMNELVKNISKLLKKNGYFVFEASYLLDVLKKSLIGTVIHEHISIHSIYSLRPFLNKYDLKLIGIRHVNMIQGGAIIGIAKKNKFRINSYVVDKFISNEFNNNITTYENLKKFNSRFNNKFNLLSKKIYNIKKYNKIIGYGAARSSLIIIDMLNLRDKIDFIIDDNPYKMNKYLASANIPIYSYRRKSKDLNGSIIVILGWAQTKRISDLLSKNHNCYLVKIFPKFEIIKS